MATYKQESLSVPGGGGIEEDGSRTVLQNNRESQSAESYMSYSLISQKMRYMQGFNPIKFIKLPFQFDDRKLREDLASMAEDQWVPHYHKQAHEGDWQSISLYSSDGEERNIFAIQNSYAELRPTQQLKGRSYLAEVIEKFECKLLSVRLLRLSAGAMIKPHQDYKLGYENNNFRIHIPIVTNSDVKFILDGDRIRMQPGECWYTNVNYTHFVTNAGKEDRIHLVIDCERNRWSDALFFSLAAKEDLIMINDDIRLKEYNDIILELQRLNEPASRKLLAEYRKKIRELDRREDA